MKVGGRMNRVTKEIQLEGLPSFLTPDEVGEIFRLGRTTVYALLKTGQIPSVRFGRQVRIPKEAILTLRKIEQ